MTRFILLFTCLLLSLQCTAQSGLQEKINAIIKGKKANIGYAVASLDKENPNYFLMLDGSINASFPTLSVYKFYLALAVLDQVDKGSLGLQQEIFVTKEELLPNTYSPLRDKFPEGNQFFTVAELLRYTVSESDNNTCDILFKLVGGPKAVDSYIKQLEVSGDLMSNMRCMFLNPTPSSKTSAKKTTNTEEPKGSIKGISVTTTEAQMHESWEAQYTNTSTTYATTSLLYIFHTQNILSEESTNFLMQIMTATTTGSNKIKGLLPAEAVVAHKTGSSFRNDKGLKAADNDVGIVRLPNGRYFYIAVFVSDSQETDEINAQIIAQIAKAVWDYCLADAK